MELVAHAEGALDNGLQRNARALAERLGDHRNDLVLHEQQPVPDAVVIHAIVQAARIAAFVNVAAGDIAERAVLHHEHRHGGGVDAGKRSDATEIVAAADSDLTGIELGDGLIPILGETLEECPADDGLALAAAIVGPGHWRTGGEDGVPGQTGDEFAGGANIDQNWIGLGQPVECELVGLNAPVRGKLHPFTPLNPNWSIN